MAKAKPSKFLSYKSEYKHFKSSKKNKTVKLNRKKRKHLVVYLDEQMNFLYPKYLY